MPRKLVVEMLIWLLIFATALLLAELALAHFAVDTRDGDDWINHRHAR
ncbi:MAG: hypothetical protein ACRDJ5_06270 [Actinomycetota bacterium]